MLTKNQIVRCAGDTLDGQMNGIARVDGQAVFVPGLLPGESADVRIVKAEKRYAFGRVERLITQSGERQTPPCPYYARCGGCSGMHMRYDATLRAKRQAVQDALRRLGGVTLDVPLPLGMDEPFHYRNKTAMPVAEREGLPCAGYYRPRSHDLTPVDSCLLAMPPADQAVRAVLQWMRAFRVPAYDERTKGGLIRHIVTRTSRRGESMVTIAATADRLPHAQALCDALLRVHGVVSVCLTVNARGDNVILGDSFRALAGESRLEDTLCGLTYQLSPLSFFQVNPSQTERLYDAAIRFAAPGPDDLVADVYCGAGTISLLAARHARRVTGIEIVPQAIADARENARRNGIRNADFVCGAAEDVLPGLVAQGLRPDIVLLDPPRKGADPAVLAAIANAAPRRIVYVSCDPATLARDLKQLTAAGYRAEAAQPVDMFCWTGHVETVCLLSKIRSAPHIDIDLDMTELDVTSAETKATYEEIKAYVLEHAGLKVSCLYIAKVKAKHGIIERDCYNKAKSEGNLVPKCPPEKEKAIEEALRHLHMIPE